jgi:hypothetical protein
MVREFVPSVGEISDIYFRLLAGLPVTGFALREQLAREWMVLEARVNNQSLKYRRYKCFKCDNEAKVCHQCVGKELEKVKEKERQAVTGELADLLAEFQDYFFKQHSYVKSKEETPKSRNLFMALRFLKERGEKK